jgi:AAA+ ATPase superfamily predicted ATPase
MDKNILIIGSARSGKTTLAKKLVKEKGYSLISIDNIVSGFEAFPELNIRHDNGDVDTASNLAPFLIKYFTELSEGDAFYDGIKYVIEGTHIDFEKLMPFLQSDKYKKKYEIIGLTYNKITKEKMFEDIKKYDTEDDWTYYVSDEDLVGDVRYFLERNKFFNDKFKDYNIKSFDTSKDRESTLYEIVDYIDGLEKRL